jgi:hypothetical protein
MGEYTTAPLFPVYMASLENTAGQLTVAFGVTIRYDQLIIFENFYEFINLI